MHNTVGSPVHPHAVDGGKLAALAAAGASATLSADGTLKRCASVCSTSINVRVFVSEWRPLCFPPGVDPLLCILRKGQSCLLQRSDQYRQKKGV
eukprot:1146375-Pelagomonas_calceolata.AAC.3